MITRLRIQNYKALRDVRLDLTPIHVLIGPNDSGKTSILEAVSALSRSVDHPLQAAFAGPWDGAKLVWRGDSGLPVAIAATVEQPPLEYGLAVRFPVSGRDVKLESESVSMGGAPATDNASGAYSIAGVRCRPVQFSATQELRETATTVHDALGGVHFYRWNSRLLALPAAPDSKRQYRMDPSGFGLAMCLDDILGYDRNLFGKLEDRFRKVFPQVQSIKLKPEPAYRAPSEEAEPVPRLDRADGKGIYFEFAGGGALVPAAHVSDGMMLVLAYLAVLNLPNPPRILLIEEPENGVHPRRLHEVLAILSELAGEQSRSQVLLTTHSPYVVDRFPPEEVTLCRKTVDGSAETTRLSESKAVREQMDVFTLGEIWTAEGDDALVR